MGVQSGGAANSSVATTAMGLPALTITRGWDIIVAVAIANNAVSVSTITDTALNTYVLKSSMNGSTVRVETWQAHNCPQQTNNIITVNLSGSSAVAAAFETYSGVINELFTPIDRTGWIVNASSSFDSTFNPFNVLDGLNGGGGQAWANSGSLPAFITLDMLSPRTFNAIVMDPRNDVTTQTPGTMQLFVSSDGINWGSVVETISGIAANSTPTLWTLGSTYTFRYIKINITVAASGGNQIAISEINVGSTSGSPIAGGTDTKTSSTSYMTNTGITIQGENGIVVTGFGFACQSGDTLTVKSGNQRQTSIPAATAVAVALYDNSQVAIGKVINAHNDINS
jgi:hypothetical protein